MVKGKKFYSRKNYIKPNPYNPRMIGATLDMSLEILKVVCQRKEIWRLGKRVSFFKSHRDKQVGECVYPISN